MKTNLLNCHLLLGFNLPAFFRKRRIIYVISPIRKINNHIRSNLNFPSTNMSLRSSKKVKEATITNKVEYSFLRADFYEKGNAGGLHFLKLGKIKGVSSAHFKNSAPNLSRKNSSSANIILS